MERCNRRLRSCYARSNNRSLPDVQETCFTPGSNPSRHGRLKLRIDPEIDSLYQPRPGAAPTQASSVNCFSMKSATSARAILTGQR